MRIVDIEQGLHKWYVQPGKKTEPFFQNITSSQGAAPESMLSGQANSD